MTVGTTAKWVRGSAIATAVVLLGVILAVAWLVGTNAGAEWLFNRAAKYMAGTVTAKSIEGTFAGELTISGLRFSDSSSTLEVQAERISLALQLEELFRGAIHIDAAVVSGVLVSSQPSQAKAPTREQSPSSPLQLPVDLIIERLIVQQATISRAGEPLLAVQDLRMAGSWTDRGIVLDEFAMDASKGRVTLSGKLAHDRMYVVEADGSFRWQAGRETLAGSLQAKTVDGVVSATARLTAPTAGRVLATMAQQGRRPWSFSLDLTSFDPRVLAENAFINSIGASLHGSGTQAGGSITGKVLLDGEPVTLRPFEFSLASQLIGLNASATIGHEGNLLAAGEIRVDEGPWRADLKLSWTEMRLPAAWVGQTLATRGELQLSGSLQQFSTRGLFLLGPPDRMAHVEIEAQGSPEHIRVRELRIRQQSGSIVAAGDLKREPFLQWDLQVTASSFDPGELLPEWDGDVDFELDTQGGITPAGPQGHLQLEKLRGTLRNRPLSGAADLTLTTQPALVGRLQLQSGASRIQVVAERGNAWDATLQFQVAELHNWAPQWSGRFGGRFTIRGEWPRLHVLGSAKANRLQVGTVHIDEAALRVDVTNPRAPNGSAHLTIDDAAGPGIVLSSAVIDVSGNPQRHTLSVNATGVPASFELKVQGGKQRVNGEERWVETLRRLTLRSQDVEALALTTPATVAVSKARMSLSQICLANSEARLCVAGAMERDGVVEARYTLEHLPLEMFQLAAPTLPIDLSGFIGGEGNIRRSPAGELSGQMRLRSPAGKVARADLQESTDITLITYEDLQLHASLDGPDARATVRAQLDKQGSLRGSVVLRGLATNTTLIEGTVAADIPDIGVAGLLTANVADVHGHVRLNAEIGGTLAEPAVQLRLHASDLAADIPRLGLKLRAGVLDVRSQGNESAAVTGSIQSGEGNIVLTGTVSYTGEANLAIDGEEFLVADMAGARVVATPDLKFVRRPKYMMLQGRVRIPSAHIDLQGLRNVASVETGSPDVVIIDANAPPSTDREAIPLRAEVTVVLGEAVQVTGFGVQARLAGRLAIREAPGQPTTASGEIRATGNYRAFGQDLTIEQGSVLYADTRLDNPSLRVTAVREVDDVTAGVRISGTAQNPELSVFSNPAMDEANALSYLVAGRPLEDIGIGQSEGKGTGDEDADLLTSAARSLGTAAGGLLSKQIGERLGIDTLAVEDSELLGTAMFTIGEYLSPRLYLSYGVGLFEPGDVITLRYRLSDEVAVRAIRGPEDSRVGIEYRVEN